MPTYGYRCTACGHEFERFQKITEASLSECESCGGTVKKMIYPVGIQFVGSGFHANDYAKSGSSKAKPEAEKTAAADTTESAPVAADAAKPAAADTKDSKPDSAASPATPAVTETKTPAPAPASSSAS